VAPVRRWCGVSPRRWWAAWSARRCWRCSWCLRPICWSGDEHWSAGRMQHVSISF